MVELDQEQRAIVERTPYPHSISQEMGIKLYNMIQGHPQNGPWKVGLAGVGLMLNSASHYDGKQALAMVVEDALDAHRKETPIEIVRFALGQVIEWRKIMLKTQPRVEKTIGSITKKKLKKELKGKLPDDYIAQIFP